MIRLIPKRRAAVTADDCVVFGKRQFAIISTLLSAAGEAVNRDALTSSVWRDEEMPADPVQTLRSTIHYMRRDVADLGGTIEFVSGAGYRLRVEGASA
jgi:DNA-binding winged helix-turn-helix (wHTH) protein